MAVSIGQKQYVWTEFIAAIALLLADNGREKSVVVILYIDNIESEVRIDILLIC